MKTPLTFLLALTFLFLFSGSVYGENSDDDVHSQNIKEGVRIIRLSAAKGNANSQLTLGEIYEEGLGVPKDYKEAIKIVSPCRNHRTTFFRI